MTCNVERSTTIRKKYTIILGGNRGHPTMGEDIVYRERDIIPFDSDTDSSMLLFGDIGVDNADHDTYIEISDEIGEVVNSTFPDFVKRAFNCPDSRQHAIQTGREIVSDRSLFLSKKRYIMHVVDDEGKRVDKLKIMGVEIKKSSTADVVKAMLMDTVNMILDGLDGPDILEKIKEMKSDYMESTIPYIATPMSCKGIKKGQDILDKTGSLKGITWHVRAALFYNSLCGPMDKKVVPGDKVGIVYIKNPKSKYVAYPLDINNFPPFMDDLIVDWDTQWEKAYKKIESYISAIGLDIKSRKKAVRKDLFGF